MNMKLLVALLALVSNAGAAERTHTVVKGDHLWGLAGHYYQNHFRWKAIYAANREKIKDPHWIYPGQVFVIPDLPSSEIGELPARPVEKEAVAAGAVAPAAAAPEPKPEIKDVPAPVKTDDLSTQMPSGFAGQYPSMIRQKAPSGWMEDGKVTEFEGRELLAAQGDWFQAALKAAAGVGDRFEVVRKTATQELDEDPKATYVQRVAVAEVKEAVGGGRYRLVIVKSADTVQVGDLLKKEAR